MKSDIDQVVDACRRKDARAQKRLYDEFAPKMLGVCMRYTHSRDEAQDLLHDGFIKIFETIDTLQKTDSIESWMNQIMVHMAINYVSRQRNIQYTDLNLLPDYCLIDQTEDDDKSELPNYSLEQIVNAIQHLPAQCRLVFNMYAIDDMDLPQIARRLHKPESTVRGSLFRARDLLRKSLENREQNKIL